MRTRGLRDTKLKPGMLFDTDILNEERDRINLLLRRRGYYYFNKEYLSYTADSSLGSNQVDITLYLKPYSRTLPDGTVKEGKHNRYTINNINVITLKNSRSVADPNFNYDTIQYKPSLTIYFENKPLIRPKVIDDELRLYPGLPYSDFWVDRTYSRFNSLGIIRSSNIQFHDLGNELNQLDCSIILSPARCQSLSFDVEGTNSWGDLGFALNAGYLHKNIFRGSELLSLKFRYAQEAYSGLKDILNNHIIDIGGETTLNYPRLMFSFGGKSCKKKKNWKREGKLYDNNQMRGETEERRRGRKGGK